MSGLLPVKVKNLGRSPDRRLANPRMKNKKELLIESRIIYRRALSSIFCHLSLFLRCSFYFWHASTAIHDNTLLPPERTTYTSNHITSISCFLGKAFLQQTLLTTYRNRYYYTHKTYTFPPNLTSN